MDNARVNFDEPVGTISVAIDWGEGVEQFDLSVDQITGIITAAYLYSEGGVYEITITATTNQGDIATGTIIALIN